MHVTSVQPNKEDVSRLAVAWISAVLDNSDLTVNVTALPVWMRYYLYIDGAPRRLQYGSWAIDSEAIYLPRPSSLIDPLTKLSVIAAIAGITGAANSPTVVTKITTHLLDIIKESTRSVYGSIITSPQHVSRLAIDQQNLQVAVEINNSWVLTSGAPVEVTDTWIIMDF